MPTLTPASGASLWSPRSSDHKPFKLGSIFPRWQLTESYLQTYTKATMYFNTGKDGIYLTQKTMKQAGQHFISWKDKLPFLSISMKVPYPHPQAFADSTTSLDEDAIRSIRSMEKLSFANLLGHFHTLLFRLPQPPCPQGYLPVFSQEPVISDNASKILKVYWKASQWSASRGQFPRSNIPLTDPCARPVCDIFLKLCTLEYIVSL